MAIDTSQKLTSGVNWDWRESAISVDEFDYGTLAPASTTTKTFTLRHDSEDVVVVRGFYLEPIKDLVDYRPFSSRFLDHMPLWSVDTLLYWGDHLAGGLTLVQGEEEDTFKSGTGSSLGKLLKFILATDEGSARVLPGEEFDIQLKLKVPADALQTAYMNFNVAIAYRRIPAG